jgi:DDE superfamily endonuclease
MTRDASGGDFSPSYLHLKLRAPRISFHHLIFGKFVSRQLPLQAPHDGGGQSRWKLVTFARYGTQDFQNPLRKSNMPCSRIQRRRARATSARSCSAETATSTNMVRDVVMMDSLPVHRVAAVREIIEAAGAKLRYRPKYSPDLNPIA